MEIVKYIIAFSIVSTSSFGATSLTSSINLTITSGKTQYTQREPIYLSLLRENISQTNEIKSTSYSFCTVFNGKDFCVPGNLIALGEYSGLSIPKVGEVNRDIVAMGTRSLQKLTKGEPGKFAFFVVEHFFFEGKRTSVRSNSIDVAIQKGSPEDEKFWDELNAIGKIDFMDGMECRLFDSRAKVGGFKSYESVINLSASYRNSAYYPYVMSYVSHFYAPAVESGKDEKSLKKLSDFVQQDKEILAHADPLFYICHLIRNARYEPGSFAKGFISGSELAAFSLKCKTELVKIKQENKSLQKTSTSGKEIKDPKIDRILEPGLEAKKNR